MTIYDAFWGQASYNHEYQEPGPNDLRSPCPFLNALANHGYINRDGRYITWWSATSAIRKVYNFSWFVSGLLAIAGSWTGVALAWNPFWFDLKQLRAHKSYLIEHDASLSRGNWPDNNWEPEPTFVDDILRLASSPEGVGHEDLARHRIEQEKKLNYLLSTPRQTLATGEVGLIIPALGRGSDVPEERRIPPDWVRSFFLHSRLPADWTRQQKPVSFSVVNHVASVVRDDMAKIRAGVKTK